MIQPNPLTAASKINEHDERFARLLLEHGVLGRGEYELVTRQCSATGKRLKDVMLRLHLLRPETIDHLEKQFGIVPVEPPAPPVETAPPAPAKRNELAELAVYSIEEDETPEPVIETIYTVEEDDEPEPSPTAVESVRRDDPREVLRSALAARDLRALVERIFEQAFSLRATDVHFDRQPQSQIRVRFRIDGQLHDLLVIPGELAAGVISCIKIMAKLDIVEKRDAQDGHIFMDGRNVRVATVPTHRGERLVARIFDEGGILVDLNQLGFADDHITKVERMLAQPHGILIATGPVGSGKTTTLYSCLRKLHLPTHNLMTVEDPVEYSLPGVNQVQVDPKNGWTFPKALRAMLRQDPNVIMVGEIRDEETAQIAVRASLTGVLVLTSMHANDASSAVATLFNFGISGYLMSTSLLGVINQRLVRCVDANQTDEFEPDEKVRELLGLKPGEMPSLRLRRSRGNNDLNSGYFGRTGVFEVLEINDPLRDLVFHERGKDQIRAEAIAQGMTPLVSHAIHKVMNGITTIEEVYRVANL